LVLITSPFGLEFVKDEEGIEGWNGTRYFPYRDYAGYWTIGRGHLIKKGEDFSRGLTPDQMTALLASDLGKVERAIDEHVAVTLQQHRFDALVSFGFNCGVGALDPENCTFIRMLNRGYYDAPIASWGLPAWNHSAGKVDANLTRRRAAECHIWSTPWPNEPVAAEAALFDLLKMLREDDDPAHA